jgi:hypothetical protein
MKTHDLPTVTPTYGLKNRTNEDSGEHAKAPNFNSQLQLPP